LSLQPTKYADLDKQINAKLAQYGCSLPTTIGYEKKYNPFLRCDDVALQNIAGSR
jgi:hypothetical protein